MGMTGTGQGPNEEAGGRDAPQEWFAFTARRLVANAMGVAESEMRAGSRGAQKVAFARQVAMYMAHTTYQLTYAQVADAFERERTTVAHACQVVEDARDDGGELDQLLDKITSRMRGLANIVQGRPTAINAAPTELRRPMM